MNFFIKRFLSTPLQWAREQRKNFIIDIWGYLYILIITMKDEQISEKLMTLEEVAEYLRLSIHTIYKMAQNRKIPALKAGKQWRFKKEKIEKWLKEYENK